MKAYQIGDQSGLHALTMVERGPTEPGPGQAVLRVHAVSLGHRDLGIVSGTYGGRKPENRVPVSDGVGTVLSVGEGSSTAKPGERVISPHFVSWLDGAFSPAVFGADLGVTLDGWLAEQIVVPAAALVTVPDTMSDAQAATLCSSALTAWNALVAIGGIKAGDLVLALGTGGVSVCALQIARLHGARVAITSSSDAKLEAARALGADILINYRTQPDWAAALMAATGGTGADIVVETGGLATLSGSIAAAAPNARIVLIGFLAGAPPQLLPNFSAILGKNLTLRGITAGNRRMLADLVRAAAASGMSPAISRRFAFDDAAAAYAFFQSAAGFGKTLIEVA